MEYENKFPNGFDSWHETHYEIASLIAAELNFPGSHLTLFYDKCGTGGMYELAEAWTTEFEISRKDYSWNGDFFDEIEKFFDKKIKELEV